MDSLQSIGKYAFYGTGLSSIDLPNSVTTISSHCFAYCKSLSEVNLPSSLETIGEYAFYNCTSLKELYIPDNVTTLDSQALHGCTGLESLNVGAGLEYLLDYLYSASYRNNDTEYKYYPLFWEDGPSELKRIVFRDTAAEFKERGYAYCYRLYESKGGEPLFTNLDIGYYYLGRPLTEMDAWTYSSQSFIITTYLKQPRGTIQTLEIGGYCNEVPYFYQSIEYLIIGENVETYTIKNIYQDDLKGIICSSATPPTLNGTFDISTYVNVVLYVPEGSKGAYQAAEGWESFWDIVELETMPSGYNAVVGITANMQSDVIGYYTTDGKQVPNPQRGINIVRYSDGSAKKVMVK